ncbi:exopolyphosphatase [uncultured Methanosphaera sp.]|uniref:Ppx/GppA phosphatase family protein n=1 Tax=uncultured Methanosphaera sp. TaxID=262501 RepID=UPI0025962DA7|nr:exopolyphosphatase [uncultured Methanosphaera sp.]
MIYSVVDIGSNTIRLQLYQYKKGKLKTIISKKKTAGLISYKENNKLNDEGIQTLLSILKSFKKNLIQLKVDNVCYFATASIRNLKNSDDILQLIKEELNIDIYLLESKTEAMMSFNAVKKSGKMTSDEGILCDVGGGSSEIVYFNNRTPQELTSIDIGSLNSYYKYVSVMLPSTSECEAIRNDVLEKIKKSEVNKHTVTHLYAVGGTIRAIKKVLEHICIKEDKTSIITPAMLKKLQSELNKNNKEYFTKILQVKAERIHTLVPGLVIIATIAEYFNIKQIHVSHKTVREGVVYSIIENDKNDNE